MCGYNREICFAKGADVGWLKQMEDEGYKFYNENGKEEDCLKILQSYGINSIRLRVWVNPIDGRCGKDEVVEMAERAINMGFKLMIDFITVIIGQIRKSNLNLKHGKVIVLKNWLMM